MEIVPAIVAPIAKALTEHITKKLRYITSSADLVEEMGTQMKLLEGQRTYYNNRMESDLVNRLETPARVPKWLDDVDEFMKKVAKILPGRVDSKRPALTSTSDVEDVQEGSDNIPSNDIGCCDVKKKYRAGRDAFKLTMEIKALIEEIKGFEWVDNPIPLGRVDFNRVASSSTSGGNTQTGFESRDKIFNDALKFLKDDDKTRVIALCGMGGVGKTTLMKQLKEAAEDKQMFNYFAEVVIGKTPNLLSIQMAIAAHIRKPLTGTDVTLMAKELSKTFEARSKNNEKILVILDDVWKDSYIKPEDIGLVSPLPNGVKLLLTSRNVQVCRQIAVDVDADSDPGLVDVNVLEEKEAQDFFFRIAGIPEKPDPDLYRKGCEIVKKCGCLPLAIKLIAATLRGQQNFRVWRRALNRLKNNDLDENVQKSIEISCDSLKQEDKAIFLLCGLFPEDSNIPIEDLTRYAWGLKLLKQVSNMEEARDSTQTSVSNLKNAFLLMDGDSRHSDCVKMHDLVLAFVVATVSKGGEDGCWIIHHDDFSKWIEDVTMSQSCKKISLACNGISEIPSDFKYPNLSLLKLMQGDELLRFPLDFYEGMKKLQVIAFQKLEYPVVPTSFQCSTNLRTLCLDECSLMFDLTCIGNLLNLEVLSFAYSGITILPSTFGNLKKLRLLDVTGCYNLVLDDGVLKNMVKLEELYMIAFYEKECCLTEKNCNELAELSEHLSALEYEFIGNNAHLKSMSFEKLNRFKLSVGCYYSKFKVALETDQVDVHSYQNSLKLITNREELLASKIDELFKRTDALYLQVNDMKTLKDVDVESPHPRHSSFWNLRSLVVSKCSDLIYLFTMNVATSLSKLEYLEIYKCRIMEAVIHAENDESDIIKFSKLKYLRLAKLPNLSSFCDKVNVIELPCLLELKLEGLQSLKSIYPSSASSSGSSNISGVQSFFQEEDATPKLEKLFVSHMENLKEIWPPQFSISNPCLLRELTIVGCDRLVKLFSCDPFPFLNNLQELHVQSCGSMRVLFDFDSGRSTGNIGEEVCTSCSLRLIRVLECDSLVNLLPSYPMPLFNHLEQLIVVTCASVEVIFDIDMGCVGELDKFSSSRLRSIHLRGLQNLREVWRIKDGGSNNLIYGFEAVESIYIESCKRFENIITPAATTNIEMRALKQVQIYTCGGEMVKCKQDDQEIDVVSMPRKELSDDIYKLAFPSSYLLHTFHHLHKLKLRNYKGVEVVFEIMSPSSRESPHNTQQPLILPYLEELELEFMGMSYVWKCNWNEFLILQKPQSHSSFHNLTTITMKGCNRIKYLFSPLMAKLLSNLKKIYIQHCDGIEEVVSNRDDEDASIYSHTTTTFFPRLDILKQEYLRNFKCIGGGGADCMSADIYDQLKLSQASWSLCQYTREIRIKDCDALSSVIPWYAVGQMQKLQVLKISDCKSMTEVFQTQETNNMSCTETGKSLPRLEYITMLKLPKLKILEIQGCHLLKHVFTFSTLESLAELEELEIKDCMAMEVIVKKETGDKKVVFPRLKSLALVNLPNLLGFFFGNNDFIWPALETVLISKCPQITVFTYGQSTSPELKFISTSLGKHSFECGLNFHVTTTSHQTRFPWSYHNLINVVINYNPSGGKSLFSSHEVSQLQKAETIHCRDCKDTEVIFDSQSVAEILNMRQVHLVCLDSLKYIWKNKQGTVLKFPNLTRLSIIKCDSIEYVFTCSMVGSILQLQELNIRFCESMKVIVKGEEECDAIGNAVVEFPCLKSLELDGLKSLEGFCLGKEAFKFPSLDTLGIDDCHEMTLFTKGDLSAPKLHAISTWDGKFNIHNRLNSVLKNFTE